MRLKLVSALFVILVLGLLPNSAQSASFDWRWANRSGETIHVELYSKGRNNVWPGNGRFWIAAPNNRVYSNRISCQRGEYICYGAWLADDENTWWGAGKGGQQACNNCCYHCNGRSSQVINFTSAQGAAQSSYERCHPRDLGARILASADTNDIHPDWEPSNAIGTAWSLNDVTIDGAFLRGTLATPRGNEQPGTVYVVASEWSCD